MTKKVPPIPPGNRSGGKTSPDGGAGTLEGVEEDKASATINRIEQEAARNPGERGAQAAPDGGFGRLFLAGDALRQEKPAF